MAELPHGRLRRFTDAQLRKALDKGVRPQDFAAKHGVTAQAVYKRIRQMQQCTITAVTQPGEAEKFTKTRIVALEELTRGLDCVNKLMAACDEWLTDPENPQRYTLDPRPEDVTVVYEVEVHTQNGLQTLKRKKSLRELFDCLKDGQDDDGARFVGAVKGEYRHADPRELILKTTQESRQIVSTSADLAKMLADIRAMQQWRELVLNAIGRASPELRDAIVHEVRSSIVLGGLLESPALDTGRERGAETT